MTPNLDPTDAPSTVTIGSHNGPTELPSVVIIGAPNEGAMVLAGALAHVDAIYTAAETENEHRADVLAERFEESR